MEQNAAPTGTNAPLPQPHQVRMRQSRRLLLIGTALLTVGVLIWLAVAQQRFANRNVPGNPDATALNHASTPVAPADQTLAAEDEDLVGTHTYRCRTYKPQKRADGTLMETLGDCRGVAKGSKAHHGVVLRVTVR